MRRFFRTATVAALVALLAACGASREAVVQGDTFTFVSPGGQTVIWYDESDRAPVAELAGPDVVTDRAISLHNDFAGSPVVINVWGSWCGPCRGEAQALEDVFSRFQPDGVEFLGINLRDDRQSARDFISDRGVGFPSIYDFGGATLAALTTPTSVVPTTVIIDTEHRPAVVFLRAVTEDELADAVERVLGENPVEPS